MRSSTRCRRPPTIYSTLRNGSQLMPDPQAHAEDGLAQFRLNGRVAFLTGATGHLGRSMAKALAGAGASVVLNARSQNALEALAAELVSRGNQVSIACFDITDENAARSHIGEIAESHGRLDVLVNNATSGRQGTIDSATAEDF